MSIHTAYTKTTRGSEDPRDIGPSPTESEMLTQIHQTWLHNQETVKAHRALTEEMVEYVNQAIDLAQTYHSHNNHIQIILLLNRAAELRKVLDKYAK
jgi:hypothetical protein